MPRDCFVVPCCKKETSRACGQVPSSRETCKPLELSKQNYIYVYVLMFKQVYHPSLVSACSNVECWPNHNWQALCEPSILVSLCIWCWQENTCHKVMAADLVVLLINFSAWLQVKQSALNKHAYLLPLRDSKEHSLNPKTFRRGVSQLLQDEKMKRDKEGHY